MHIKGRTYGTSEVERIRGSLSRRCGIGMCAVLCGALLLVMGGCIRNDIPYPRIQPNFTEITAEGLLKSAEIDSASRFVVLTFDETVDIHNVKITGYKLSPGAYIENGNLDKPIDLSRYYIVTLALYQSYDWVIQGVQNIERYFTVENQIGEAIIDVIGRRVVVDIAGDLDKVKILTAKLGPEGSTMTPKLEGSVVDLTEPLEVKVESYGREEIWSIHAEQVESTVQTLRADAWTQVAWVYGAAIEGRDNGVEYRIEGDEAWIKATPDEVVNTGSTFYARLVHLQPMTTYEARTYSDREYGAVVKFTTGMIEQVPNTKLSEWNLNGKIWNPWAVGAEPYWDTGNKGATTLGESNTRPTTDTSNSSQEYAAQLETKFVGIGPIGKLAAGNIFVGSYVRTDGTNGILSFGRPFTQRPTRLTGYMKYKSEMISHSNNELTYLKGRPDTCIIWIALIDSNEPFEIRTNPNNRHLFNPEGSEVVAYGKFESGQSIPEYIPFDIKLEYTSTQRVPKYILITASASKYGDYFTGGAGSVMCLDDLELQYDY